jgi:hypothetical protein
MTAIIADNDPRVRLRSSTEGDKVFGRMERVFFPDAEMVELMLLLPRGDAAALEQLAYREGLTVGQLMRRLLQDGLASAD